MIKEKRYWDSSVICALLNEEKDRAPDCVNVINGAKAGKVQIIVSALAIAEVLKYRQNKPIRKDDRQKVIEFFQHQFITVVTLDRWIAFKSQEVHWDHNVPPRDAVHVATALRARVNVMESYDGDDLLAVSGKIGSPPLVIRKVQPVEDQPGLFDGQEAQKI